jgi:hypothetical protein
MNRARRLAFALACIVLAVSIVAWCSLTLENQPIILLPVDQWAGRHQVLGVPAAVVIARQAERAFEQDAVPHRNSQLAIYLQTSESGSWALQNHILSVRSNSTSNRADTLPSLSYPDIGASQESGYESVPYGLFGLKETDWKNGERAFLVSDWGRDDGIIALRVPQVIHKWRAYQDPESGDYLWKKVPEGRISSWDKRRSYFHPSHTRYWSHGDSKGCLNLYKPLPEQMGQPDIPAPPYDWDVFLGWLDELGLRERIHEVPLVIVPLKDWADEDGDLPETLPADFLDRLPPQGTLDP